MSELGRRLTSQRRPGPEQSQEPYAGSRASTADSGRGASRLPPLPHHVRLALHRRQHRPPTRSLTTTQPTPVDLAAEPQLVSPSVSLALPGASLAFSTAERSEAPYPRARLYYLDPLLVSPAFRHVGRSARFLLTWSEEGGGGNLARVRVGPLCNLAAGAGRLGTGKAGERLGPWRPGGFCWRLRSLHASPFVARTGNLWDQREIEKWFREQEGCKEFLVLQPQ